MSGGSFNYLGFKDAEDLVNHMEELEMMQKRLMELGFDDAAKETSDIIFKIEEYFEWIKIKKDRLEKVWLAVEWMESGDSGLESVKKSIKEYREPIKNGC